MNKAIESKRIHCFQIFWRPLQPSLPGFFFWAPLESKLQDWLSSQFDFFPIDNAKTFICSLVLLLCEQAVAEGSIMPRPPSSQRVWQRVFFFGLPFRFSRWHTQACCSVLGLLFFFLLQQLLCGLARHCDCVRYSTAPPLALPGVWPAIRKSFNFKESLQPGPQKKKKATEFQWVKAKA